MSNLNINQQLKQHITNLKYIPVLIYQDNVIITDPTMTQPYSVCLFAPRAITFCISDSSVYIINSKNLNRVKGLK